MLKLLRLPSFVRAVFIELSWMALGPSLTLYMQFDLQMLPAASNGHGQCRQCPAAAVALRARWSGRARQLDQTARTIERG